MMKKWLRQSTENVMSITLEIFLYKFNQNIEKRKSH